MGCTAPVDKYYLKAPPLQGKHIITQHLAFVAVFFCLFVCFFNFFVYFFLFVPLTSWYHILGRCCVSISIVNNWNKCKLLFFESGCWDLVLEEGQGAHNRKPFRFHISFPICCSKGNGWFTSKLPLASPLWQSYTLAFTWKSKNPSLLVVKERGRFNWLQIHSGSSHIILVQICPKVQAEITNGFAMRCWHHLQDLPHSLFFS